MEPSRNERKLPWRKIILAGVLAFIVFTTLASWGLYKAYTLYKTSEMVPVMKDAIASPMHTIIITGDRIRFADALKKKTSIYDLIEGKGPLDCRPLMIAVLLGRTDFAKELIERGAEINAGCINFTPLELSIVMRDEPTIRLLHSKGALTTASPSGKHLSPYAAAALNPATSDYALNTLADQFPLMEQIDNLPQPSEPDVIIELLLELYGKTDLNTKDDFGSTPLFTAAQEASEEAFEALLKIGADYKAQDNENDSILSAAARSNCEPCVRRLIALGLNVNHANTMGMTPLAWAASEGSMETTLLLLESGAKKTLKISGKTAAELAEEKDQPDAAALINNFKPKKK